MEPQFSQEVDIDRLLEDLNSGELLRVEQAGEIICAKNIRDARIINALTELEKSADPGIGESVGLMLDALDQAEKLPKAGQPDDAAQKKKDFWKGFGLWWGLNILMGICAVGVSFALSIAPYDPRISDLRGVLNCLPLLINIGLLIFFGVKRTQVALGVLAAFSANLVLNLVAGVLASVGCFVASFSDTSGYVIVGQLIIAAVTVPVILLLIVMAGIFFFNYRSSQDKNILKLSKFLGGVVAISIALGVLLIIAYLLSYWGKYGFLKIESVLP